MQLSDCSLNEGSESIEDLLFNIRKPSHKARIGFNPVVKVKRVRVIERPVGDVPIIVMLNQRHEYGKQASKTRFGHLEPAADI